MAVQGVRGPESGVWGQAWRGQDLEECLLGLQTPDLKARVPSIFKVAPFFVPILGISPVAVQLCGSVTASGQWCPGGTEVGGRLPT